MSRIDRILELIDAGLLEHPTQHTALAPGALPRPVPVVNPDASPEEIESLERVWAYYGWGW